MPFKHDKIFDKTLKKTRWKLNGSFCYFCGVLFLTLFVGKNLSIDGFPIEGGNNQKLFFFFTFFFFLRPLGRIIVATLQRSHEKIS